MKPFEVALFTKNFLSTGIFIIIFLQGPLCYAKSDADWLPPEFKDMLKSRQRQIEIFFGGRSIGEVSIQIEDGAFHLLSSEKIIEQVGPISEEYRTSFTHFINKKHNIDNKQVCNQSILASCAVPEVSSYPILILDESRLRARMFLSSEMLGNVQPDKIENIGQRSAQREVTLVQNLNVEFAGDELSKSYNLDAQTAFGRAESYFDSRWGVVSYDGAASQAVVDQAAFFHDFAGRYQSAGLIDAAPSATQAMFRSLPDITLYGLDFGTSNNGRPDKQRTNAPIDVYLPTDGRVEVYRDGRLISTQGATVGRYELDTTTFPAGTYEVEVRVVVGNNVISNERRIITKNGGMPNANNDDYRISLGVWGTPQSDSVLPLQQSFGAQLEWARLLMPAHAIKSGGFFSREYNRAEIGMIGVWPLDYDFSLVIDQYQAGVEGGVNYSNDQLWWYFDGSYYPAVVADNPYITSLATESVSTGIGWKFYPEHQLNYRYNYYFLDGEDKLEAKISNTVEYSFGHRLFNSTRLSITTGMEYVSGSQPDSIYYVKLNLIYSKEFDAQVNYSSYRAKEGGNSDATQFNASMKTEHAGRMYWSKYNIDAIQSSSGTTGLGLGGSWESELLQGNINLRHDTINGNESYSSNSYYGSLSSQIASENISSTTIGYGDYNESCGFMVDLTDAPSGERFFISINGQSHPVNGGRVNWVPLKPHGNYKVRLTAPDASSMIYNISGFQGERMLYPGNVVRLTYSIDIERIVFGVLKKPDGRILKSGLVLGSDSGLVDNDGQFEVRLPVSEKEGFVKLDDGSYCSFPIITDGENERYMSIGLQTCTPISQAQVGDISARFMVQPLVAY